MTVPHQPPVPSWLDLDGVAPPAIRKALADAAAAVEALLPALSDACEGACRAAEEYEKGVGDQLRDVPGVTDNLWELFGPLTGADRLYLALDTIEAYSQAGHREAPIRKELWPDWFRDEYADPNA